MKKIIAVLMILSAFIPATASAGPRDEQWEKVREAIDKGLSKTAIEEIEPIIAGAMKDNACGEAIKAIGMKIAFEGDIQGNRPEEKIIRLRAEIAKAPEEMKPMMEAILANWYWHYFQHNRWRFMQRTQTAGQPGEEFTTWDLPRILSEIDKQFTQALFYEKTLKITPITAYSDLLEEGTAPDIYRPTLFDFLAHNALEFYSAAEQGGAKAEDEFALTTDSPIFGPVTEFVEWRPQTTDTESPTLKAIRLYQHLLTFHKDDKDPAAFIDADLWRLNFGYNRALGDDKNERYKAALEKFVDEWGGHEVSARALAYGAQVLQGEREWVAARNLAQAGLNAFPKSAGGVMCFNIIQGIEAKSATIRTERVWNDPLPTLAVTYRNITKVFFRAVSYDFETVMKSRGGNLYSGFDDHQRKELLGRKPALEWSADLPATTDFKERVEKLPAPKDLKPGFYFIVSSHEPSFDGNNHPVSVASLWVSDLALVMRRRQYEGSMEGFVLKALTGEPVAGANVRILARDREGGFKPGEQVKTDGNGLFKFERTADNRVSVLLVESGGHQLSTATEFSMAGRSSPEGKGQQTVFFTDRSLYRPGQTINYKGICIRFDQDKATYETLAGQSVTVIFADSNNQEIEKRTHKCNDYGAFNGVFTAPRDRVTGRMTLTAQGPNGAAHVSVEEYKRPKFQVELAVPKEAAMLNGEVVLTGKATAYTGAAIGGAKVKWRIMRQVRFPPWCWWSQGYFGGGRSESQAIAHGSAVTETDGSFTVKFTALPDLSISGKDEPVFLYTCYADVTDTNGETRAGQRALRVAYTALAATLGVGEWQTTEKPVEVNVRTATHDGEGLSAHGTVRIYRLKQPDKVQRAELTASRPFGNDPRGVRPEPKPDPSNPNSWEIGQVVSEIAFETDGKGNTRLDVPLNAGIYRAMLETKDPFGKVVTARLNIQVVDTKARQYTVKLPTYFSAPKWSLEPGESFLALWGTGYDKGRAFVEVECRGKLLRAWWTAADRTQEAIEQVVSEDMRGGFTVRVTFVRENRAYLENRVVDVPWSNKRLTVKWEHFTSRLGPGRKETWTAVVTGPDAKKSVAEMAAGLYDASLDSYLPHNWMQQFGVFRREVQHVYPQFQNSALQFQHLLGGWPSESRGYDWRYRAFPREIIANQWGYGVSGGKGFDGAPRALAPSAAPMRLGGADEDGQFVAMEKDESRKDTARSERKEAKDKNSAAGEPDASPPGPDLGKVTGRKNLNETAFFFPHLISGEDGVVKMEFTIPEALTEWNFLGFAHDKALRSGFITDKTVTAKELMVEPNPPRFVREGDRIEFTVKVSNQSTERQTGKVTLTFADTRTLKSMDVALDNKAIFGDSADEKGEGIAGEKGGDRERDFDIPPREARTYSWRIAIPDGMDFLTYKAVGATAKLSDGEEGILPVLSRRILVTESLPLPIRGKQTKKFEFTKLLESGGSKTLRHENLTVQMVSQPAWYAVMALPYLMEYPYECSEQTFNRLYANALARHIGDSDPKIRRIFELWKATPALDSPMEKNQELKQVMLEETPWYRQAMSESQARRNVGILFDANRLDDETARGLGKLSEMQLGDGRWPWFPGGPPSDYITLYITTGFGRLRHLGVDLDISSAKKSLTALDAWMDAHYRGIIEKETYVPGSTDALYLYGRSFFLKDQAVQDNHTEAVNYFLRQSRKFWLKMNSRQSQAHLAIAVKRFNGSEAFALTDDTTPADIMKSMKERSVSNEELGMFWRDLELSWWWFRAPIETQAMMIEAFDEVMGDRQAVEDCRVWLLKQKQTQDWKTTKATADAIYALLLRGTGTNPLTSDALVEVSLGGKTVTPGNVEAGTGFYEKKFVRGEIKPELGHVTVKKVDEGVSWGSLHWQYLEDMTKVTPYEGTPLRLKKTLFIKDTTKKGQVLKPVTGPLAVGDELVVRVELRVDRDMEYIHLKDQRGSGTEPVTVLSRYKYQDGLAYYESTRDTASHFFIDYLPKGVYVFEYPTRIQLKGKYQTGIAGVQCMYAPEFNSHSESFELEVR
ncbi:MAG: alpha-2-macroglobulin family protein [Pseudomonadota bacterium]